MIQSIRLQQFRSYMDDSFEFKSGVNIIVGPNASGKTNLLEALLVLARGTSYRVHDQDLVMHDQSWARLDASVDNDARTMKLVIAPAASKTFEIGGRVLTRLSLERTIPVVLFEPNHLNLFTGSPERRREYLDDLLLQTTAGYGTTIRAYKRTLAQRNRLLKSGHVVPEQLFPWDVRLSELGGRIVRARDALVEVLQEKIGLLYRDVSRAMTDIRVSYQVAASPHQYESIMLRQLEQRRTDDIIRGFTSFGPHRDDLVAQFNGIPAGEVASRGEIRTLVLGLKILELQLLQAVRDVTPLLLLDDVFSELDGVRRQALTRHLQPYQTFITTTDADVVIHHFADHSNVILMSSNVQVI
jgi:DNA replication and repair protein RecF